MSTRISPFSTMLSRAGLPALAIIAMAFFGYHAVVGPYGVLKLREYRKETAVRAAQLAELEDYRKVLQNRVGLLDFKRGVDRDMADELIRKDLNVARPDEIIVPLSRD